MFRVRPIGAPEESPVVCFKNAEDAQAFVSAWYAPSNVRVSERDGAPVNVFD